MTRLSTAALTQLPPNIETPGYDRATVRPGVVHIGLGAFHRAHQVPVFERALAAGDRRWGIIGASLRSPDTRDALAAQDHLYTVVERDGGGARFQVVGAVLDVLVAPEDPAALVGALASPDTHLVTLTVTEKGYWLHPATGALMIDASPIAAELNALDRPTTAVGFLVAGLAARRLAGLAPFTVMSCDNLPGNGDRLRGAVLTVARHHDPALADWIACHGAFPNTMVDRIVPATTPDAIDAFTAATGVEDRALVTAEPFHQWVIENRFAGPCPDFAALGAQLTDAVAPWEAAKLRLLNGAHSALAYLGGLAGLTFVHDAVGRPPFRAYLDRFWREAMSTLSPPPGLDSEAYCNGLIVRFGNPVLAHRLRQIAQDGSQKLPQRLVAPLLARHGAGLPSPALALAIAGWMRWVERELGPGEDPLSGELRRAARAADPVGALLCQRAVFPAAFPAAAEVAAAHRRLGDPDEGALMRMLEEVAAA